MSDVDFDFTELMKPQSVFIEPIVMYASLVEQQFGQLMFPNKAGIYRAGEMQPVIVPERRYFFEEKINGVITMKPITDFQSVNASVVDENGKLVIAQHYMKNKEKLLFSEPTIPARGILVIKALVEEHIAKRAPHVKSASYSNKLKSYFLPDAVHEVIEDYFLERICESLLCKVDTFMGNDICNIYFTKIIAIDLCIEKCIDYRIYEWTLMKAGVDENGNRLPRYSF